MNTTREKGSLQLEYTTVISPSAEELLMLEEEGWRFLQRDDNGIFKFQRWNTTINET